MSGQIYNNNCYLSVSLLHQLIITQQCYIKHANSSRWMWYC